MQQNFLIERLYILFPLKNIHIINDTTIAFAVSICVHRSTHKIQTFPQEAIIYRASDYAQNSTV